MTTEQIRAASKLTWLLAERALSHQADSLPRDIVTRAQQCVIDWFAVTLAALGDPVRAPLIEALAPPGGRAEATVIGHSLRQPAPLAALINGATAHALDFDDVNLAISGHPSAVIFPAVLALAELEGSSGADMLAAFVAGYETACRVGVLICPDHLERGFHATGTVGSFGAAAACAHLLKFDAAMTAAAMGLAGTQAAGLKAMFGTMAKPLHAGLAARAGLESTLLVKAGFGSRDDILECRNGFAQTHSADFNTDLALGYQGGGYYMRDNLFKFDVSCYGTHSAIECIRRLKRQHPIAMHAIERVSLSVDRSVDTICNIPSPKTGLQGKFSLRLNAAFSLLGIETRNMSSYSDEQVNAPDVTELIEKIHVQLADGWPPMQAAVTIEMKDGQRHECAYDAGIPNPDLEEQDRQVSEKFMALSAPIIGTPNATALLDAIRNLADLESAAQLLQWCRVQ